MSRCNRTGKLVLSEIQCIEKSWKRARDWAQQTGQGVLETNPDGFEEAVMKYYRFYYVLLDVMQDRASSKVVLTTNKIDLHEDDASMDSCDVSLLTSSLPAARTFWKWTNIKMQTGHGRQGITNDKKEKYSSKEG